MYIWSRGAAKNPGRICIFRNCLQPTHKICMDITHQITTKNESIEAYTVHVDYSAIFNKDIPMKKILLLACTAHLILLSAQNPTLVWAKKMGGTNTDQGYSIATDAAGSVYTTGYFNGTADFDPGTGTATLTSAGGSDVFVSKLDASGNFVWAVQIGGTTGDEGRGITLDASGNIYVTGYFSGTADFDPGSGTSNMISAGSNDIFVLKLNSSGALVMSRQMGGPNNDVGTSITRDAFGNIYSTGYFSATADFDPGAAVSNLMSTGSFHIFVSKLNSSGNYVWAKAMGSIGNDIGYSIATDPAGNVYTCGHFSLTADFDPGTGTQSLTSAGVLDAFISKLDSAGNYLWSKSMGSTGDDVCTGLAIDASGYVYTAGYFFSTVDFDPGAGTYNLTTNGVGDIFVSKVNASGNFVWARNMGSTLDDFAHALAVDSAGGVYTTGYFAASADMDPGAGTSYIHSYFPSDSLLVRDQIFVSKLDSSGTFAWAVALGGVKGYGIAATVNTVYSTGFFTATADFDPAPTIFNMTTSGSDDTYVHRMNQSSLSTGQIYRPTFDLFPNPCNGNFTIRTTTTPDAIVILDILGNELLSLTPVSTETQVNMNAFASGLYFVRIISANTEHVNRLVLNN